QGCCFIPAIVCIKIKYQLLALVKTEILVFDVVKLAVNDDNRRNEHDRQKELEHYQRTAYAGCRNLVGEITFHYLDGLESRKVKGRIAACQRTSDQYDAGQHQPNAVMTKERKLNVSLCNLVQVRQCHNKERYRQRYTDQR